MTDTPSRGRRVLLLVAAGVFLGWMGWLGYAALTKYNGPVVSRSQAALATHPVVAEVAAGEDGKPAGTAKVIDSLRDGGPAAGTELAIANLPGAAGFSGPGPYLLLLAEGREPGTFEVAGRQRSAGYDPAAAGVIYPWTHEVQAQAATLVR